MSQMFTLFHRGRFLTRGFMCACLGVVWSLPVLAEQHRQLPNRPPKLMFVDVSIERARHTRGGDEYGNDDKSQDVKLTVSLFNRNSTQDYKDLTGYYYVVAQEVTDKKHFKLIIKGSDSFNLPGGQKIQRESGDVHLQFDDHEPYRFGFKYYGYVYLVEDKTGKVILGMAEPDSLWQKANKLADHEVNDEFSF